MDIDFPLWLSWAVLISGTIWLLDALVFRAKRDPEAEDPIIVEYARSFFPVLLLVLILRSFLAEPYQIPSASMVPTLEVGDFILVNKYAYGLRLPVFKTKVLPVGKPARGDVMVFVPPHDKRYFIKRVIGLPGDHIRYVNKALYINGERMEYELIGEHETLFPSARRSTPVQEYSEDLGDGGHRLYRYPQKLDQAGEWTVPADSYFMMGDNRGLSEDSRVWGFAEEKNIVGKAVAVWMHKEPGWHFPTFSRNTWF